MPRAPSNVDPDDFFADTRMSFGDHIEELRSHLIRAIAGFFVGMAVSLLLGKMVVDFITAPVEAQLMKFYERRTAKIKQELEEGSKPLDILNKPTPMPTAIPRSAFRDLLRREGVQVAENQGGADDELISVPLLIRPLEWSIQAQAATRLVQKPPQLSTMSIMEAFMVWVKVCAFTGLVLSSPWVFYQLWAFVAAGLYPHEKRYVHVYLPVSLGLFLVGVFVCEFLVLPKAIDGLLWFNEWLGLEPDLRLNEWLSFALLLPLVFGLAFQTPLVMLFLAKIGVFDADSFRKKRKVAWFVMAIFAAVFTPADAISMLLMWAPMCLLYELGILMVSYAAGGSEETGVEEKADELVEV
jgi:sec-independent protein translocase protein TatC